MADEPLELTAQVIASIPYIASAAQRAPKGGGVPVEIPVPSVDFVEGDLGPHDVGMPGAVAPKVNVRWIRTGAGRWRFTGRAFVGSSEIPKGMKPRQYVEECLRDRGIQFGDVLASDNAIVIGGASTFTLEFSVEV